MKFDNISTMNKTHSFTRRDFLAAATAVAAFPSIAAEGPKGPTVVKGSDVFTRDRSKGTLDRLLAGGHSPVFVDIQDAIAYPSHPEIATANSLAAEKAKDIVAFYRAKGIELTPLLDFSTAHDSWLGEYDRMVSSKPYRKVVRDVIFDAYEIFGRPKYIHIGFESEDAGEHPKDAQLFVMRQGDPWMRELKWTASLVREAGAEPWAWFDYPWGIKDFTRACPTDVVFSNLRPLDPKLKEKLALVEKAGARVVRMEVAK